MRIAVTIICLLPLSPCLEAQDVLSRGPYLQQAAATRITIRWRGALEAIGRVRYGTAPANLDQTADETAAPGAPFDHIVTLTGLSANTTYHYEIGSPTAVLASAPDFVFTTPPLPGTAAATRIWVMGDAGTGNANQLAVRDAFHAWAATHNPDLVLQLGDNAYSTGRDAEFQTAMFDVYQSDLCRIPFWSCLGNHETYNTPAPGREYPYFEIYSLPTAGECGGAASGTEHYYAFDYGNIHLISLDSMASNRSATGAMATWLTTDLAGTTATWILCFFHHPPYSKGSHNSDTETELIEMRKTLLPILEAGGVDLVLSGHSHCYERSFLLDGHYGKSDTLVPAMKKNGGDGRPAGGGAYLKPLTGPRDHSGAVYCVAGSAGLIAGGPLNHPAHSISLNALGSLALDIQGPRLDATFIGVGAGVPDTFTVIKQGAADSDHDQIPDSYEILHGLNRLDAADALLDADGDGSSNLTEYVFGRPASTPDRYCFTAVPDPVAGTTITLPTVAGRSYQVWWSETLLAADWHPGSPTMAGTGGDLTWIDDGTIAPAAGSVRRFYRIVATVAP